MASEPLLSARLHPAACRRLLCAAHGSFKLIVCLEALFDRKESSIFHSVLPSNRKDLICFIIGILTFCECVR